MSKTYDSAKWIQLISEQKNSNQTLKEWCKSKGITKATLYYWKKRLASESNEIKPDIDWIPVTNSNQPDIPSSSRIKLKIEKFTLEIESNFDKTALNDILKVVMSIC